MNMSLLWLIAGTLLVVSEFVVPGFIICFFGVAAIIVSAVCWFVPSISPAWQLLLFAVIGVVLLLGCRRFMPGVFRGKTVGSNGDIDADDFSGEYCVCTADISPESPGKVEFRGSAWSAVSDENIAAGVRCVIVSRSNLTLKVRK